MGFPRGLSPTMVLNLPAESLQSSWKETGWSMYGWRLITHPPTERAVQTLKCGLQRIRTGTLGERLCRFLFTYRITLHATTGQSPAEFLFSRRPRSRLDLVHPDTAKKVRSQQDKQVQGRSQDRARQLEQGQKVYVKNFGGGPTWLPGVVQDRTGPVSYRVQMEDGREIRRHVDHLRNRQEGETWGGGQTFVEGPSTTRELTPPLQQNEEPRGREQPPNALDGSDTTTAVSGSDTVAAEAGGRAEEEEFRGPKIETEEPRRSTRTRRPPDRLY